MKQRLGLQDGAIVVRQLELKAWLNHHFLCLESEGDCMRQVDHELG